jgi:aspartyl-tRNA(Asn)/glutamyl-tRNA(Gln) amidotransferase subunit A
MALSWTMDKIGPLCRSAEDCGLVLQEIAGGDREDPGSAGKSFYYAPQYQRKLDQIRVGYATSDFEESAEEVARPAFRAALDAVRGLGVKLVEIKLPELPYSATAGTIVSAEGSAVFEPLIETGRVNELADARQIAGLKAGLDISAKDYLKAMRIRRMVQDEMRKVFVDADILLSPSRFGPASRIDEPLDRPGPGRNRNPPDYPSRGLSDLGAAGNLAGLPSLSLPCGFADGLPVAIQLVSRPFTENLLLIAGIAFQKATDWHRRRPPE